MFKIKRKKINAYIMALYVFQFGLIQPIASIVNSQWPIAAFTILLTFIMLISNSFKIKNYVLISFVVVSVYFLLNALIFNKSTFIILPIYAVFILKSFSAFLIGSLDIEGEDVYNAFLKISILNFIAIFFSPFVSFFNMEYMRFGYAMIPSVLMFFYATISKKNMFLLWFFLLVISFILTFIYGARGSLVIILLFLLVLFYFTKRLQVIKKFSLLSFTSLILFLIVKFNLFTKLIDYIYYELGVQSYTILKFNRMINSGIVDSSSGRDVIYKSLFSEILQNPIIGYGIGYSQLKLDFYAHNIFLQILIEAGVIGLIFWSFIWFYSFLNFREINNLNEIGLFRVVTLIFSIAIGRLLLSSDMWVRPEYWFVLSILINFKYYKINKVENNQNY